MGILYPTPVPPLSSLNFKRRKYRERDGHSRSRPFESCALPPPDISALNVRVPESFRIGVVRGTLQNFHRYTGLGTAQLWSCQLSAAFSRLSGGVGHVSDVDWPGGFAIIMAPDLRVYLNPSSPFQASYSIPEFSLVSVFSSRARSSERLLEP